MSRGFLSLEGLLGTEEPLQGLVEQTPSRTPPLPPATGGKVCGGLPAWALGLWINTHWAAGVRLSKGHCCGWSTGLAGARSHSPGMGTLPGAKELRWKQALPSFALQGLFQ